MKQPKAPAKKRSSSRTTSGTRFASLSPSMLGNVLLWQCIILVALAFVVYGRTISYGFVNDDRMVITQNTIVKQGMAGIPELLTNDSFYGFDKEIRRSGQRKTYRPLSFVMFAVEWQLAPNNPALGHFVQVALYAALGVVLLLMLRAMLTAFKDKPFLWNWLPFTAAALFVLHPIHTEVVCNIKSRDELLALLCLAGSVLLLLRHVDTASRLALGGSLVLFVLALLSKESAVTFLPVVPVLLWCCRAVQIRQILALSAPFALAAAAYLALWFGVVGRVEEAVYVLPLTNPFVNATLAERTATATWVMLMYLGKAVFPVTLSQGYTFNEIPLMNWLHWKPLCSLFVYAALIGVAAWKLPTRHVFALCVVWFCSTMAIASNLVVYAGGFLGERFLFTPSVAVMLAVAWVAFASRLLAKRRAVAISICVVVGLLYANKTLSRAADWSSEAGLAVSDAAATPNSYIAQLSAGRAMMMQALSESDVLAKSTRIRTAIEYFNTARSIDSVDDPQLYTLLGLAYAENGELDKAMLYGKRGVEGTATAPLYRASTGFLCYAAKCYAQSLIKAAAQPALAQDSMARRGLMETGIGALRMAIGRDTPVVDVGVEMTLANCYDAIDRYDSAMFFAERALTRINALPTHRTNAGIIAMNWGGSLMQQEKPEAALAAYSRALPFDDANPRLHWSIGNAYVARARYDSATMAFRRAVALDPTSSRLKQDLMQAEAMAKSAQSTVPR
jgi:tetratricopeptide (TPR) repeat protein